MSTVLFCAEGTAVVSLTRGQHTLIDESDVPILGERSWFAIKVDRRPPSDYRAASRIDGKQILLHRLIAGASPELHVDHINHNSLDNRRVNLCVCEPSENRRNSRLRRDCRSGFKGVVLNNGTWLAQITVNRGHHYLGRFKTAEDAARDYDAAAREHFGEFACLNFPETSRGPRGSGASGAEHVMTGSRSLTILPFDSRVSRPSFGDTRQLHTRRSPVSLRPGDRCFGVTK